MIRIYFESHFQCDDLIYVQIFQIPLGCLGHESQILELLAFVNTCTLFRNVSMSHYLKIGAFYKMSFGCTIATWLKKGEKEQWIKRKMAFDCAKGFGTGDL